MKMRIALFAFLLGLTLFQVQAQETPELVVSKGHTQPIMSMDIHPNNRYIATGGQDRLIKIWDRTLQQEFRTLYGHVASVRTLKFVGDSDYLVSYDGRDVLFIWNYRTGKRLYTIEDASDFSILPDGMRLVTLIDGDVCIYDVATGKRIKHYEGESMILRGDSHPYEDAMLYCANGVLGRYSFKEKIEHDTLLHVIDGLGYVQIRYARDKKQLMLFEIQKNVIHLYELSTQKILKSIQVKKPSPSAFMFDVFFDNSSTRFFVIYTTGEIQVYDIQSERILKIMNEPQVPDWNSMQVNPNLSYRQGTAQAAKLSADGRFIALATFEGGYDGRTKKATYFNGVRFWDVNDYTEIGALEGTYKWVAAMSASFDERYMLVTTADAQSSLRVWDIKAGELEANIPSGAFAATSSNGRRVGFWEYSYETGYSKLSVYEFPKFERIFETNPNGSNAAAMNADGRYLAVQEVKSSMEGFKVINRVWDIEQDSLVAEFEVGQARQGSGMSQQFQLSPDGAYLIYEGTTKLFVYEVRTQKLITEQPIQALYENILDFVPNTDSLLLISRGFPRSLSSGEIDDEVYIDVFNYKTGTVVSTWKTGINGVIYDGDFSDDGKQLVLGQGGYYNDIQFNALLVDWPSKEITCTLKGHTGPVRYVWFGNRGKNVYSTGEDAKVKVWNLKSCKEDATFLALRDDNYIIVSPEGYYKTTQKNTQGVGFRYQERLYTFDQFDVQYNRPDKVAEALGASKFLTRLYRKAYEKRLKRLGYVVEDFEQGGVLSLPQIEITNTAEIPTRATSNTLTLKVKASDNKALLDRVKIYVNDVPVYGLEGFPLKGKQREILDRDFNVKLSAGRNLVQVSVLNTQGLESVRENFEIMYTRDYKPNLYMLTIGVSEYQDSSRNLTYASKDARDLARALEQSGHYNEVHVKALLDQKATLNSVAQQAQFLKRARLDDQVLIYVSSHGLLDDSLNYFLAMHDTDFARPAEAGLPYESIEHLISQTPARNRLVLIDACHSGEIDRSENIGFKKIVRAKEGQVAIAAKSGDNFIKGKTGLKNSFTYMKTLFADVAKGTGVTVISAAGGYEFALESSDWNNGVFTYSILKALQDANADIDHNEQLTVSELKEYVTQKVVELTDGRQRPTTRRENILNDFVIYTK